MAIACLTRVISIFQRFLFSNRRLISYGVDEAGDCSSEAVTTANRSVTSLNDKEEPTIFRSMLFALREILHSLTVALAIDVREMPLSD